MGLNTGSKWGMAITHMGKLTPEMKAAIKASYAKKKSYKEVADELKVNWKTVKAHVVENGSISTDEVPVAPANGPQQAELTSSQVYNPEPKIVQEPSKSEREQKQSGHENPQSGLANTNGSIMDRAIPAMKKSPFARAIKMFEHGMTPVQVAYSLNISFDEVQTFYAQFGKLKNLTRFYDLCQNQPPIVVQSLLKLYDKMRAEHLNVQEIVEQLRFVEPLSEASKTYHRRSDANARLDAENQRKEDRNSQLDSEAKQIQAKIENLKRKSEILNNDYAKLQNQYQTKQMEINQQKKQELAIISNIHAAEGMLNDLTSENGRLKMHVKGVARDIADYVVKDEDTVVTTCVAGCIAAITKNVKPFMDFFVQYPIQQGEDLPAYCARCKQALLALFKPIILESIEGLRQTAVDLTVKEITARRMF